MTMPVWVQRIFWIDGLAGLSVGVFVLVFHRFLARLYGLPVDLVIFMGLVNVAYSVCGLTLAVRARRPLGLIVGLSSANYVWACVCVWLVVRFRDSASVLGLATLLFEGAFVAALATIEWRNRHALAGPRLSGTHVDRRVDSGPPPT
jgi:hypothetical protein